LVSSDQRYEMAFDTFDYVLRIVYQDVVPQKGGSVCPPPGAFGWRKEAWPLIGQLDNAARDDPGSSPLLRAGLFGRDTERLLQAAERQRAWYERWRERCGR
jgi:hypothetical protein